MNAWKQQSVTVPNECYKLLAHHELQYIITSKILKRQFRIQDLDYIDN